MNTIPATGRNIGKDSVYTSMPMKQETGMRVSKPLREKIKRAAMYNGMSMVDYLDSIVPEIKMEEVK